MWGTLCRSYWGFLFTLLLVLPGCQAQSGGVPIWGQNQGDSRKSGVTPAAIEFSLEKGLFPIPRASFAVDTNIREVRIDAAGVAIMYTFSDLCVVYYPESSNVSLCNFQGDNAAFGNDGSLYTLDTLGLRRYVNGQQEWISLGIQYDRISLLSQDNSVFLIGINVTVVSSAGVVTQEFNTHLSNPFFALSPDESVIYLQYNIGQVQAVQRASGLVLWSQSFDTPIESVKVTESGMVILDTLVSVNFLNPADGTILQTFDSADGVNTLSVFPNLLILNRDRAIVAYNLTPPYSELYRFEGTYDFVSPASGAEGIFFIGNGYNLEAHLITDGTLIWEYRFDFTISTLHSSGNNSLYLTCTNRFYHLTVSSNEPQEPEAFPLWFLAWILPLVALVILFIYYVYRQNSKRHVYEEIN